MKHLPLSIMLLLLAPSLVTATESTKSIATISNVEGSVLIEHNDERVQAESGMSLHEGDTIFVLEKATADLAYASCNTTLDQNTLLTISEAAPCASGDTIGVGVVNLTAEQAQALSDAYNTAAGATNATAASIEAAVSSAATNLGLSTALAAEATAATMAAGGALAAGTALSVTAIVAGVAGVAATVAVVENQSESDASPS